jgi:nucleoid DNA-binding protein
MVGSNYWITCTAQDYPETYGITKVVYGGFTAYIPYLLSGTPIYNPASPVINAAERYKNYAASFWAVKYAVKNGEKLVLVGFGTFSVNKRAARAGRNPRTGKEIQISAKNVVKFKAGAGLSENVN